MLKYLAILGILICSKLVAQGQNSAGSSVVLYLSHAQCMRERNEQYLTFVEGPTLIFPGFCEEENIAPSPAEVAAATSQNSLSQSSLFTGRTLAGNQFQLPTNPKAAAVVLTSAQIRCLGDLFKDVVEIDQSLTDQGTVIDTAEFLLDRC